MQWWSAEPERLSAAATKTLAGADLFAVAAITWFELAWLAVHERIVVTIPLIDATAACPTSAAVRVLLK